LDYDAPTIPTPTAGETVARAKRTERAEARRRYRAATIPDATTDAMGESAAAPTQARSKASPASKPGSSAPTERVGFVDAFKLSIRPLHVREDIAALPSVALHSRALWVPVLITILSTVATAATGATDIVTGMLFTYFVVFPAVGGVFLAGFLAPRASWLVGVVVGLVSALCYILLGVTGRLPVGFADQFNADTTGVAVSALIYSPILGGFFAASAAWYRRFLALSSPNRNRRGAQGQKGRSGDGRTRAGTSSQKAGAKR
jgi:hypothetical protein